MMSLFVPASQAELFKARLLGELAVELERQDEHEETRTQLMPHQMPPEGEWFTWLLEGGRGSGKTHGATAYVTKHVHGPPCISPAQPHRVAIIAPTLGDAVESFVTGPSGLRTQDPGCRLVMGAGGMVVRWSNGSEAKLFGAHTPEDADRLRAGGNRCLVAAEELSSWRQIDAAWDHALFGLRLGPRPHVVASSTPKPRKRYLAIRGDDRTRRTGAPTMSNPHLAETARTELLRRYEGTRLGRQELYAEILTDVPGALWTHAMLEDRREAPELRTVVVAIDPAVTATDDSDDTGIVVAGVGVDGRGYVLADRSCRLSPDAWARRALAAYEEFSADMVVAEVNNGGDLVEHVMKTVNSTVRYKKVHASRGKSVRAQPVSALYEQGRVSHCGVFTELEEQLTTWTPESGNSPDRLDALVWALTELMVTQRTAYVY